MLVLKHCSKDEEWRLLPNQVYTVGRKDCDICLPEDSSVSRKHAKITIQQKVEDTHTATPGKAVLEDLRSRFNTFVNDREVLASTPTDLEIGDTIKFGRNSSSFKLKSIPIVVTTSLFPEDLKQELTNNLAALGGRLISEWDTSVTHLVVKELTYTPKVMCALAAAKPIVTPDYFADWKSNSPFNYHAKIVDYQPKVNEPQLVEKRMSLLPNAKRSSIFAKKTFLFTSTRQLKRIKLGIHSAGGRTMLLDQNSAQNLLGSDFILVESVPAGRNDTQNSENIEMLNRAKEVLSGANKRQVPESEIGLAIAFASTSHYCNPYSNAYSQSTQITQPRHAPTLESSIQKAPLASTSSMCTTQHNTATIPIKRELDSAASSCFPSPKRFKPLPKASVDKPTETEVVESQTELVLPGTVPNDKRKLIEDQVSVSKRSRIQDCLASGTSDSTTLRSVDIRETATLAQTERVNERATAPFNSPPNVGSSIIASTAAPVNEVVTAIIYSREAGPSTTTLDRTFGLDCTVTMASFLRSNALANLYLNDSIRNGPCPSRNQKRFKKGKMDLPQLTHNCIKTFLPSIPLTS